jgi:hypothetical protein
VAIDAGGERRSPLGALRFGLDQDAQRVRPRDSENSVVTDLRLFQLSPTGAEVLSIRTKAFERSFQTIIDRHIGTIPGPRLLASDIATGRSHGGSIDTLGLDENGCPVIVEYKGALRQKVINQDQFYLDCLLDHRAVKLVALDGLGRRQVEAIAWDAPGLLCVAGDFSRYDVHAIKQIDRSVELIRYRRCGADVHLLELAAPSRGSQRNATTAPIVSPAGASRRGRR